jgi:tetratricopeptide (TPR) repeat protein
MGLSLIFGAEKEENRLMAVKKVSRKKLLKEPDEFISITAKIIQYLRGHRRQLSLYGIAVLVVAAGGAGGYYYFRAQEAKAQRVQDQAFQVYQEALSKETNAEAAKDYRKALEKFKEGLSVYGRGNIAQFSQIYIGNSHYALKEYDQAIAAYSRCLEGPFRSMALDGLGYSYEAKGDYTQALEYFRKNMEGGSNPYQEEDTLAVARCYEELKQNQKALEVYQKALARNPQSRMAGFMQWKVGELKG